MRSLKQFAQNKGEQRTKTHGYLAMIYFHSDSRSVSINVDQSLGQNPALGLTETGFLPPPPPTVHKDRSQLYSLNQIVAIQIKIYIIVINTNVSHFVYFQRPRFKAHF